MTKKQPTLTAVSTAPSAPSPKLYIVTDEYRCDGEDDGCLIGVYTDEALALQAVEETEAYWEEVYDGSQAQYHSVSYYEFDGEYNVTCIPDFESPADQVGEDDDDGEDDDGDEGAEGDEDDED